VRLSVKTTAHGGFTGYLLGYAYETAANKAIRAGQTTEAKEDAKEAADGRGPSLGALAAGAEGLPGWRTELAPVRAEEAPVQ
jgi:hypothetical protein